MRVPTFKSGLLPLGETDVSCAELAASYLVSGKGLGREEWDADIRGRHVDNLQRVVRLLQHTGMVTSVVVAGSFVQLRDAPSDIDAYFELRNLEDWDSGAFELSMQKLDPTGGWCWSPSALIRCGAKTRKLPFWCRYRVDLYPDTQGPCGIKGRTGKELTIAEAFRQCSDSGVPKGVLRIRM